MENNNLNNAPTIVNANEPHMACLFLLDTSGSMGAPSNDTTETLIGELNAGLNRFKEEVCMDKTTKDILEVAIVEFNSTHRVIQPFVPVEYMEPVNLMANGGTNMSPAIRTAIDMVEERVRFYKRTGTQPYKPWIILISDGAPQDDITEVSNYIHEMEENNKLKFFSLGVENYDSRTLHMLSGPKVMRLKENDFKGFFDWVNKSMRSVSVSSPGEIPKAIPLTENLDKDTTDWML